MTTTFPPARMFEDHTVFLIASFPVLFVKCVSSSSCSFSWTMESSVPPLHSRDIDLSLKTCRESQCNSHGHCVAPPGGDTGLICECDLGYDGESCEKTFNGNLSVPLTTGIIAVMVGLVILAFILTKLRQRQKKNKRKKLAAKHGYNIPV
ncbi:hypothetical protein ATANTOWER_007373 [Ataeniobius toweri]|uniref:EGF-like domain-containing protein n=1 Tax=Ataeniobius toweri TaxID=208326 RepID=A0ABU7BEU8_9TELE|nr:hypothetical protein [Ataeniobius toweri]